VKLRTVVFGVYVAASAVGFVVLMRFMLAEVRPRYVTAVRLNLQGSAHLVAAALNGRTPEQAAATLAGQTAFRVRLMAADGRVLFDSSEPAPPSDGEGEYAGAGLAKRAGDRFLDGKMENSDVEVTAVERVRLADGSTGLLVLSRSFRSVNAVIWSERKKLAAIALIIASVMLVTGWWITTRLTNSLERLTLYARDVRDGRPVPPPPSHVIEISTLAQAFEEMRDALEGRQHAERYTQALAHEVKAPLAAIRGAAELLSEEMPAAERQRFLANIRTEGARIEKIIERLLELSSLEARKALQQIETIDAGELLREAVEVVRPACEAARVALVVQGGSHALRGERVLLREALVNQLQNALDFSPTGGEVTASVVVEDRRVVWTIEDRGPGVPDYALSRVFDRFYSLPRPGASRKSTGLGLALVREIAHLHGGEATLTNRPEGGARATLSVPSRTS
jgi:two-component system sensor histidine kinase CreC